MFHIGLEPKPVVAGRQVVRGVLMQWDGRDRVVGVKTCYILSSFIFPWWKGGKRAEEELVEGWAVKRKEKWLWKKAGTFLLLFSQETEFDCEAMHFVSFECLDQVIKFLRREGSFCLRISSKSWFAHSYLNNIHSSGLTQIWVTYHYHYHSMLALFKIQRRSYYRH